MINYRIDIIITIYFWYDGNIEHICSHPVAYLNRVRRIQKTLPIFKVSIFLYMIFAYAVATHRLKQDAKRTL